MTNRFIFSNHNKFFDDIPSLTLDHESGTFFVIYYSDIFMFVYGFIPDKTKNDYDMIAIYSPNLADVVFEMKDTFGVDIELGQDTWDFTEYISHI